MKRYAPAFHISDIVECESGAFVLFEDCQQQAEQITEMVEEGNFLRTEQAHLLNENQRLKDLIAESFKNLSTINRTLYEQVCKDELKAMKGDSDE